MVRIVRHHGIEKLLECLAYGDIVILEPLVLPNLPEFVEFLQLDILVEVVLTRVSHSKWRQSNEHGEHYYAN